MAIHRRWILTSRNPVPSTGSNATVERKLTPPVGTKSLSIIQKCFECGCHNPQWVSVSYGIWICLECSGKHRGLGVHLSFVRSVTMDKWKDAELEKMKSGGNRTSKEFMKDQSDYNPSWSFQQKYNSRAAALLRDKVSTEAKGEGWSETTSSARDYKPFIANSGANRLKLSDDSASLHQSHSSPNFSSSTGYSSSGYQTASKGGGSDDWNLNYGMSKDEISSKKEDYFNRRQQDNASRPEDLPPSQGGRYAGFGSSPAPPPSNEADYMTSAMSSLSVGWTALASGMGKVATYTKEGAVKVGTVTSQKTQEYATRLNENVVQPTKSKVQEGTLLTELSAGTKSWASRMASTTAKGWRDLTTSLVEDTSEPAEQDKLQPSGYQDMPLMTDSADHQKHTESSSLLDLDQSDTPLLLHSNPSPRATVDEEWNDWGNTDWDADEPAKTATPAAATDEDGWEDWGNQKDLLIDFGDSKPPNSASSTASSKKTATTKTKSTNQKKVASLEETWDDAGGWDDAAWDAVEQEVGRTPAALKSSKAD